MKSRYTLILMILALPFLAGFGGGGTNLLLIQISGRQTVTGLRDYDITPYLRGDEWVLAGSSSREADLLERAGYRVSILDTDAWSEPYYLVSSPRDGYVSRVPSSFRELARVPEGVIVKGADRDVYELTKMDLDPTRIRNVEIPLVERRILRAKGVPQGYYGPENYAVSQVSDSTITDYITRLEAFQTRYSYTDSVYAASQYIFDKFEEFGYSVVEFDSLSFMGPVQRNVVAVKFGTINPEKVIVVGGHYDSVTYDSHCDPDTLAPGVDDDGSGTVVTMEAARVLATTDTDITVMFVPFAAEEQGLWGSYHFAEEAYNQGMDILLMFNLDMVANLTDSYWDVEVNTGNVGSGAFAEVVSSMAEMYTDLIPFISYGASASSDHYPFDQYGYDYVYIEEGDFSPNWHRCTDTVDNISIPYLTDVAETITASILYFANTPQVPTGLSAVNVGDGTSIYVSWDANSESDLAGYNISFGTESGVYDSTKSVDAGAVGDTLGNLVEGTALFIAVSAFDGDGYESFLSPEIEIIVGNRPQAPTGLVCRSFTDSVTLSWERNTGELDVAGYNVYRRPVEGSSELLGYVTDPTTYFNDATADPHILYAYHVTAVDSQVPPNESDPSVEDFGRLATHDMGVLVVDNTKDGSGGPFMPTDEEVDDFYDRLLSHYNVTAVWDVADSIAASHRVRDYDIGIYSTVIWHSEVRNGISMAPDTVTIKQYLDSGGNLWLSGWQLLGSLTGETGGDHVFETGSFVSEYLGLDSAVTTTNADVDFIGADGLAGEYLPLRVDTEKVPLGAIFSTDVLYEPFDGTHGIYSYVSSDSSGSEYHGMPVGVESESGAYGLIMTDFPVFFMENDGAASLVETVMSAFGEPAGIEDEDTAKLPLVYGLSQNYPNPFNPATTITVEIPRENANGSDVAKVLTNLSIFDVRGRLVRVLMDEELSPGRYRITWDGKDANGREVSSGIYFYRVNAGTFSSTRKMTLMK